MKKDTQTWWRDWNNGGAMIPEMEPLIEQLHDHFGNWQYIMNNLGLADADFVIEQLWAIREDLA